MGRFADAEVGGDLIAGFQQDDVPGDQFESRDGEDAAAAKNPGVMGGELAQSFEGAFGPVFLNKPDDGVQDDDDDDGDGVFGLAQSAGDDGGGNEDDDHEVRELCREHRRRAAGLGLADFIQAMFLAAEMDLFRSEAGMEIGSEVRLHLLHRHAVPGWRSRLHVRRQSCVALRAAYAAGRCRRQA